MAVIFIAPVDDGWAKVVDRVDGWVRQHRAP